MLDSIQVITYGVAGTYIESGSVLNDHEQELGGSIDAYDTATSEKLIAMVQASERRVFPAQTVSSVGAIDDTLFESLLFVARSPDDSWDIEWGPVMLFPPPVDPEDPSIITNPPTTLGGMLAAQGSNEAYASYFPAEMLEAAYRDILRRKDTAERASVGYVGGGSSYEGNDDAMYNPPRTKTTTLPASNGYTVTVSTSSFGLNSSITVRDRYGNIVPRADQNGMVKPL